MGNNACAGIIVVVDFISGAKTVDLFDSMSTNSLFAERLRFLAASAFMARQVVGILRAPLTDMAIAGIVPILVAIIASAACSSSHRMVSPSDLWPSSRVSWKIRAAHVAGIRMRRPRHSTLCGGLLLKPSLADELLQLASCCPCLAHPLVLGLRIWSVA